MSEHTEALRAEMAILRAEVESLREQRSIEIRGAGGELRLRLSSDENETGLFLYDAEGRRRAALEVGEKGPRLELFGNAEESVVTLKVIDGHGHMSAGGPDGVPRAALRSTKHGGVVKVMNERGRTYAYMLSSEKGGVIELLNPEHRPGISLLAETEGGMIRLHEGSGEVMLSLSATSDAGLLTVFGNLGEQAVTLCASEEGGHVLICDPDGIVQADLCVEPPEESENDG
jgi:hypothetical protein